MSSHNINYNKHMHDIFTNIDNINNEQNVRKKKFTTFFTKTEIDNKKKYKLPLNISQFKYREQSTTNLRNIISKKEKKHYNTITEDESKNLDTILEETNQYIYKTKWNKLGIELKYNRIFQYAGFLKNEYNLTKQAYDMLKEDLFFAIKKNKITNKNNVIYDDINGKIISIKNLNHNEKENIFSYNFD